MAKVDLRKELKTLYRPSAKAIVEVQVPAFTFLMIDGQGDPNRSSSYAEAVETLFTVAYTARFHARESLGLDYAVMPLEGLWWAEDMKAFASGDRDRWQWTMMILQPDAYPPALLRESVDLAARKKSLPALGRLRIERFEEGACAQVLHIGPFTEEGPVIERLHAFIDARGELRGRHHEIYLSDIRRAEPARWKTVLRQPLAIRPNG